jgi:hypothetical protein
MLNEAARRLVVSPEHLLETIDFVYKLLNDNAISVIVLSFDFPVALQRGPMCFKDT